jgi:Uma2 family endonuclease
MAATGMDRVRDRPISVGDYHRMGDANIFRSDERVELLNGRIVAMPPIGPDHAYTVTKLDGLLRAVFGGRAEVRSRQPLTVDSGSEPEPDLILARNPAERYRKTHPTASDVFLVIEVSNATLAYDRGEKLAVYARSGVREYWIVNIADRVLEQHVEPKGEAFAHRRIFRAGDHIAAAAFPTDTIAVAEILGPP